MPGAYFNKFLDPAIIYKSAANTRQGIGIRPSQGPDLNTALALSQQLAHRLEPYILQPQCSAPDYGSLVETGCWTGSTGNTLILRSKSEMPDPPSGTKTIDLTPIRITNGSIVRYRLNTKHLAVATLAGNPTSDAIQFNSTPPEPGEIVVYIAVPSGTASPVDPMSITPPAILPFSATKMAVKIGYYPRAIQDAPTTDCTAGCTIPVEHSNSPAWKQTIYLKGPNSDGSYNVVAPGAAEQIPAQHF